MHSFEGVRRIGERVFGSNGRPMPYDGNLFDSPFSDDDDDTRFQASGLGGMRPNTVVLGEYRDVLLFATFLHSVLKVSLATIRLRNRHIRRSGRKVIHCFNVAAKKKVE